MHNTHTVISAAPTLDLTPNPKKWALRVLNWVIAKDQAYRDKCHFNSLSDEALKDVGLHR